MQTISFKILSFLLVALSLLQLSLGLFISKHPGQACVFREGCIFESVTDSGEFAVSPLVWVLPVFAFIWMPLRPASAWNWTSRSSLSFPILRSRLIGVVQRE